MYSMASMATDVLPEYDGHPNDYYADSLLGIIGMTPVGHSLHLRARGPGLPHVWQLHGNTEDRGGLCHV